MSMKIDDNLYVLGEIYREYLIDKPSSVDLKKWIRKKLIRVMDVRTRQRRLIQVNIHNSGNTVRQHITRSIKLRSINEYVELIYCWLRSQNMKKQLLNNTNKLDKVDGELDGVKIEEFFSNHKF